MKGPGLDISSLMGGIMMPPAPPMNTSRQQSSLPVDDDDDDDDDISDIVADDELPESKDDIKEVKVSNAKTKRAGRKKKVEINL